MLKQILKDMYIDPELLEQLGEEQKQIIFRKIREEQLRRWGVKEKELENAPNPKRTPRKIDFLLAANNKPWVWVMGEHKDDIPYDEIVRKRETKKQEEEQLAEIVEAKDLAKKGMLSIIGSGSTDEPDRSIGSHSPDIIRTESQLDVKLLANRGRPSSARPGNRRSQPEKIIIKTPEEQQRLEKEHVAEVLGTLRRSKSIAKKRAAEVAKKLEDTWRESQKKASIYDQARRRSFKFAREKAAQSPDIHEKILEDLPAEVMEKLTVARKPTRPAPPPPKKMLRMASFVSSDTTPKSAAHVVDWFRDIEAPKGVGRERDGSISIWFHGKVGRETAMRVLESEVIGSYLVRMSAKLWGYTVSVRTYEGSRHFLVDASSGKYHFLGPKQQKFTSLNKLLEYYKTNPITWEGQELLLIPVALEDDRDVYGGLYSGDSDEENTL